MKITAADPRLLAARGHGRSCSRTSTTSPPASTTPTSSATRRASWCCATPGRSARPACPNGVICRSRRSCSEKGVTDLLRISDARMSGTSYGAVVLHVAPESAVGGPLALVRGRRSDPARRVGAPPRSRCRSRPSSRRGERAGSRPSATTERGYRQLHVDHVLQANEGCDFDFLRGKAAVVEDAVTYL